MRPKGFVIAGGYMGLLPNGQYRRFDTEGEYLDYIKEDDSDDNNSNKSNHKESKNAGQRRDS